MPGTIKSERERKIPSEDGADPPRFEGLHRLKAWRCPRPGGYSNAEIERIPGPKIPGEAEQPFPEGESAPWPDENRGWADLAW